MGAVSIAYDAEVLRAATAATEPVSVDDQLRYLRPSRYCPSDRFGGWAHREFDPVAEFDAHDPDQQAALAAAVTNWVFERTDYVLGSSSGTDSAVHTLLIVAGRVPGLRPSGHHHLPGPRPARPAGRGVRPGPVAHGLPRRGRGGHRWPVAGARRDGPGPSPSLVRIATGRDAADTAFVTVFRGQADLTASSVHAVVDGDLPGDDHDDPVELD